MNITNVIEAKNIVKKYKGFTLNVPEFHVPEGFATALVGENGAGKTTLMNILSGILANSFFFKKLFYPKMNRPIIHVASPYRINIPLYFNGSSLIWAVPRYGSTCYQVLQSVNWDTIIATYISVVIHGISTPAGSNRFFYVLLCRQRHN